MKVFDVWGAGGSRWLCSNYTFNTSWINDNYYYKIVILFFFSSPKFYPTKVHQLLENLVYQALALCQLFLYSKYSCLTLPLTWHPSFLWELLCWLTATGQLALFFYTTVLSVIQAIIAKETGFMKIHNNFLSEQQEQHGGLPYINFYVTQHFWWRLLMLGWTVKVKDEHKDLNNVPFLNSLQPLLQSESMSKVFIPNIIDYS